MRVLSAVSGALALAVVSAGSLRSSEPTLGGSATSCTPAGALASNVQVTMDPSSPVIGGDYSLTITFDLAQEVTAGSITYDVSMSGFPVSNTKDDLCTDVGCPLPAGANKLVSTGTVPDSVPHGSYDTKMTTADADGNTIYCIDLQFTV